MYKATADDKTFSISVDNGQFIVDGKAIQADIKKIGPGRFHIIAGYKIFVVEIVSNDSRTKSYEIKVNGTVYPVQVADKMDALLEKMGYDTGSDNKTVDVTAPMPGLILEIAVKPGEKVAVGDKLLVLEAMKMENIIKSPGEAIIDQIKVKVGDSVEFGQTLMHFE
jgi:biotin carboxyl carrier protein